jgi:hypothetical protein
MFKGNIFSYIYDNFLHLGEIYCCFQEEVFHEYILSSDEWLGTWLSWKLITENKEKYSKMEGAVVFLIK